MPSYSFKKEAQVHIVNGTTSRYQIDVSEISFSQTFAQHNYSTKTLHSPSNVFEGSVINKANKANFEFEFPAIVEEGYKTAFFNHLLNVTSFDLYVKTEADIFKLETAVITNGTFVIEKSRPLSITIQGEASKLTRGNSLPSTSSNNLSPSTKTYMKPVLAAVTLNTVAQADIVSVSMELQNEIKWTPYTTLQNSLSATDKSNSMFPSAFTVSKKVLSGSITKVLTDAAANTADVLNWDTDAKLTIKAGVPSPFRGFFLNDATCSFTNRIGTGGIFTQNYDWRMTESPSDLSTKLDYTTDT